MKSRFFNFVLLRRDKFLAGASVLTLTTFGSYVLGLVRDRMFARTFGAVRALDVYNAAFIIPDLLLNILVAGALSAAFIPIFSGLVATADKEKIMQIGSTVMNSAISVILIFGSIAFVFMPYLAPKIAPGFSAEEISTLIFQSRIFLLSPLIFAVSNSLGAMLISYKTYLAYGLSPMLYNLGIICGILFVPQFGILAVIFGTLFGAVLHLLSRLIGIFRTPFKYQFVWKLKDRNFLTVVKLMIPKMFGHPVEQLNFLVFTNVASGLAAGSVAVVSFARNFQSVPVALFGIAFSLAIFPMLSEAAAKRDKTAFLKHFKKALKDILILVIPSALGLFFLSKLIISIFLGGGNFTGEHIERTAFTLSLFAFAVPTESVVHLLARAFYSMKDTLTPVLISILGLTAAALFAFRLAPSLDIAAIPLAFFAGSAVRVILLSFFLPRKLKKLQ